MQKCKAGGFPESKHEEGAHGCATQWPKIGDFLGGGERDFFQHNGLAFPWCEACSREDFAYSAHRDRQ